MRSSLQNGFSFLHIIGIIFLVIFGGCFVTYGALQLWHYKNMIEIKNYMSDFFQKYQEGLPELVKTKSKILGTSALKPYNLIDKCEEARSIFNNQKIVCQLPLC